MMSSVREIYIMLYDAENSTILAGKTTAYPSFVSDSACVDDAWHFGTGLRVGKIQQTNAAAAITIT